MRSVLNSSVSLRKRTARLRVGFTLIELMVVIVIIAILIGLLLPAVMSVRRTARDAEVRKDISDLEQAIAQFKVSFGIEPPSRITLYAKPPNATGAAGTTPNWDNDPTDPVGCKRYKGLIKQMWPRFDFSNCGGASDGANFTTPAGTTPTFVLNGSECLVFFLGGMIDYDPTSGSGSGGFIGFAKDPAHPFAPLSAITNREGPFFEFKGALNTAGLAVGRLTDKDLDWIPEYKDTLPGQEMPYVYLNAASGSYRTTSGTPPPPLPSPLPLYDPVPPSWYTGATWYNTDAAPLMYFAYYSKLNNMNPRSSLPYKPKGIQIISPGADHSYGWGGQFDPNNTGNVLKDDRDNITNFHSGRLGN